MARKRIVQLIVFASVVLLAVGLVGGIGCSNDKEPEANDTTQQDVPLLTSGEAASLVYQYLDDRLEDGVYRTRLNTWGGKTGTTYAGDHKWTVSTGIYGLGLWYAYERTETVTPGDITAQNVARLHFK